MAEPPSNSPRFASQQVVAALLIAGGLAYIGWHQWAAARRGGVIEIERAPPLVAHYQVDINRAQIPEFLLLPEIGEALARRIVEDREANGPFRDHDDLRRVSGIGPKTLETIRPYLLPLPRVEAMAGP
jgi:competence protein ComEA